MVNFVCVTVGTPHQGVGLSAISVEPRSGFTNIAPTLETFRTDINAGISEDVSVLGGIRWFFGDLFTLAISGYLYTGHLVLKIYCYF